MCYNCLKALYSNYLSGISHSKISSARLWGRSSKTVLQVTYRIFNAFNHHKRSRENSKRQYSPGHTKEENIIGGKEKTVSPDTVLKDYWSGNEEFADLFNAVLFGGSQVTGAYTLCHAAASYGIRLCHL